MSSRCFARNSLSVAIVVKTSEFILDADTVDTTPITAPNCSPPADPRSSKAKDLGSVIEHGRNSFGEEASLVSKDLNIGPRVNRRGLRERNMPLPQPNLLRFEVRRRRNELLHGRGAARNRRRDDAEVQDAPAIEWQLRARLLRDELEAADLSALQPLHVARDEAGAGRLLHHRPPEHLGIAVQLSAREDGGVVVEDQEQRVEERLGPVRDRHRLDELRVAADGAHAVLDERGHDERLFFELEDVGDEVLNARKGDPVAYPDH